MSNVHNLFPDRVTQEAIIEYLQKNDFDDVLVITAKGDLMELRNTLGSLAEVNAVLDLMKLSLLLGVE